jgi:hypothetical protein
VNGRLLQDRMGMLAVIDDYLSLIKKGEALFQPPIATLVIRRTIRGLTQDILSALSPYLTDEGIDTESIQRMGIAKRSSLSYTRSLCPRYRREQSRTCIEVHREILRLIHHPDSIDTCKALVQPLTSN